MTNQTVLTKIVQDKKQWIANRKIQQPLTSLLSQITKSDRDFSDALRQHKTAFILECKKASPSKGLIRADFDPAEIAKTYRPYASVISVLTDEKYFQGQFEFLPQVRAQVHQPVLCKDFIIDEYQLYLARFYQADAILLMLSVLDDATYLALRAVAESLNMGVLTEVSNEDELQRAVTLNAPVIGINNRNLHDLSITLDRTRDFAPRIPADRIIISESGIHSHQHVRELCHYVNGFLVGSALMSEPDLSSAVKRLILGENKVCGLTRAEDAQAAFEAGAIYGGLIFAPDSPRAISPENAANLMQHVPLKWVGVFRHASPETIIKTASQLNLSIVQLHGDISDVELQTLHSKLPRHCQIWLAVDMSTHTERAFSRLHVDRYVCDNGLGGTGHAFDWQKLPHELTHNIMLAGGIHANNLRDALSVGCIGLDLNSGIEDAPGRKNAAKMQAIFTHIRQY